MLTVSLFAQAFFAGLVTFVAPCTLPLVPGYLGFISGVSLADINDPTKARVARGKIVLNGLFFILGFSIIFIAFGLAAGAAGSVVIRYRSVIRVIGGIFVTIFGLYMLEVIRLPFLASTFRIPVPALFKRGRPLNSFILGISFGTGWTPCIGPILASVLFIASTQGHAFTGGLLLAAFAAGLGLPFFIIALAAGHAASFVRVASRYSKAMSIVGGIFLLFLGILLITNNFGSFIGQAYKWLHFLNYEGIYRYL